MRYSVTGTTELDVSGMIIVHLAIEQLDDISEFTTGGAFGIDTFAASFAYELARSNNEILLRGCFPMNKKYNYENLGFIDQYEGVPGDYMDRNNRLVWHADCLLAFPKTGTEEVRSGTWATIRRARNPRKFGIDKDPIEIRVYPLNGDEPWVENV
jgi:hypothetical protein